MTRTDPASRPAAAVCPLYALSAGTTASAVFAAGHGVITGAIVAAAGIITTAIVTLGREYFWLRALRSPYRNLDRIHQLTGGSAEQTELLMRLLADAENNVLEARASCQRRCAAGAAPVVPARKRNRRHREGRISGNSTAASSAASQ
jgi:hypothetical protein